MNVDREETRRRPDRSDQVNESMRGSEREGAVGLAEELQKSKMIRAKKR